MLILVSHPTGNANVRGTLDALAGAGMLGAFHTAIVQSPDAWWASGLPAKVRERLTRRAVSVPSELAHSRGYREWTRLLADRLGLLSLTRHESGWASIDAVYRDADRHVARCLRRYPNLDAVYAYEDGARATFIEARKRGLRCLYELPIGYWKFARQLLKEEAELQPAWASTLTGNLDSDKKLSCKDDELGLADAVYVASSFTRRTLELASMGNKPVHVISYGAPSRLEESAAGRIQGRPLQVLFVGSLGQRKGLSYLLEGVQKLGSRVELTLIGKAQGNPCEPLLRALSMHRHIASLPHQAVLEEMRRHDVLVFPSLFEGFGLVLLEAMSQGLPVIATDHTAGPDLITDGNEGFIIPIRSADAIAEKLVLLEQDRDRVRQMGQSALHRAAQLSWRDYATKLVATLTTDLQPRF